jgi:DNA-binding PadR family transcriptional regulator
MIATTEQRLLLGEWACLGVLAAERAHGFAVAARLRPDGDIGRIWSMSRALTYRSLDQLAAHDYVRVVAEEQGIAGGTRTILAPTSAGRRALRSWLTTPVTHLRDLRSELLLKLTLADECGIDITVMLDAQRDRVIEMVEALATQVAEHPDDAVTLWRAESSQAALRFLDRIRS